MRTFYMTAKAEPHVVRITVEGDVVFTDLSSEIRVPFVAAATTKGTKPVGWDTKSDVNISFDAIAVETWNDPLIEEAKRVIQQEIRDAGWLRFLFDQESPDADACCPTDPTTAADTDDSETDANDANEPL